jgi:stearoyl-CoA desaturase (delta-9 desaturase)
MVLITVFDWLRVILFHNSVPEISISSSKGVQVNVVFSILIGSLLTQISTLCTSAYLHRGLAHKAVNFHGSIVFLLRLFLWLTTGVRAREWAAVHRKHHAFTDTENDPHSPAQIGWIRVQLTNFWLYKRAANDPRTVEKWGKDLSPDRFDKLLFDKGWLGLVATAGILCGFLGWWLGLLAFGFHVVSYVMLSGAVNAVGHTFGSRPNDNSATNLHWLAAVTSGEGYHNNHHDAPTSAQFGRRWFDLDAAWWLIKVTEKLGISNVRKVGSEK